MEPGTGHPQIGCIEPCKLMSALGQERSFRPGQPNVRFAPKAVIGERAVAASSAWDIPIFRFRHPQSQTGCQRR